MSNDETLPRIEKGDDLRLLGLSRIPRCAGCARLEALAACHERRQPPRAPLPAVPRGCISPYCAPLAARYAPAPCARITRIA